MTQTLDTVSQEDISLINQYARRELSPEEVYTFSVKLCDNETDRDGERFSITALENLAELFVGKTGIFDHVPKSANQTARIYSTEVVRDPERRTNSGEVYTFVRAKAYMMRTDSSNDLIKEIDGGIKKEVSVSCAVKRKVCSLCGADMRTSPCSHVRGYYYGEKRCDVILDGVTDAYEWSFVAVPAQPEAGITKSLAQENSAKVKALEKQLDMKRSEISVAKSDLIAEIIRLGQFCTPAYNPDTIKSMCRNMELYELVAFKEKTRSQVLPETPQSVLRRAEDMQSDDNTSKNHRFKLHK